MLEKFDAQKRKKIKAAIIQSHTVQTKAIFPNTVNHYDTLFGGTALKWMDELAFICATRFSKQRVVTVSSNKIDFKEPIPSGCIAELTAKVIRVGTTSVGIQVDIHLEEMYSELKYLACSGEFTFVSISETKKPINMTTRF
jgi:acyl-CoA hydrolase